MSATDFGGSARAGQQSRDAARSAATAQAAAAANNPSRLTRRSGRWVAGLALSILLLSAGSTALIAAPATYSGEAPVVSQSEAERSEALKTALAEVVIRISGDPGILANGNVAAAVAEAGKYVLQYRYQRGPASADPADTASPRLILVAEFDSNAVDRMLAGLGLGSASAATAIDTTPTEQQIWISGIHSADDYARGLGYLSKQSLVRQSWPVEARGDGLLVRLTLSGGLQRWLDIVDGEGVLRVNNASPPLEGIDATLVLNP
ncbi:DUF2066 domain-containing protein [Dokdonella sp.]|uniref:DUF2066 domain-containing protein n=1 Tax=Dokdonella sp. TaxID=2291710 RepID=UPI003C67765D